MVEHHSILSLLGLNSKRDLYTLSIALFLGTYAMIILEKFFHRVPAALLGGSFAVFIGLITPEAAWRSVDMNTLFLLLGMMITVSVLIESGFFTLLARAALKLTGSNPTKILIVFATLTAVVSAFLDNVTTVLFVIPILLEILLPLEINPVPFVIAVVLASNIGGTATLIGDPPNIIIGSIGHLTFNDFLINLTPIVAVSYAVGLAVFLLYMKWRGYLTPPKEGTELKLPQTVYNFPLMRKGLIIFGLTLLFFVLHHRLGIEPGIVALTFASLLLLWTRLNPETVFERVEWGTLLFFVGLFIVIGTLAYNGVFEDLARLIAGFVKEPLSGIWVIGTFSAAVSGIVDNIPFTMAMAYVLKDLANTVHYNIEPLWWALSLGACLGGNLTLIGASANVVAAGILEREGYRISFLDFLKMGTPVAFFTVLTALFLLWLRYAF
jgi:Na+/H+ antiporter NhaD/arsenite permease-like protein